MVTLDFSLVGSNADVIPLDGSQGLLLMTGFRGLGIAPTELRITASAGDGGTWRSSRRGVRDIDLPLYIEGVDRGDVETKLRRLTAALNDRTGVSPKILATYSDGTSYEIDVRYAGGADTQFGTEAGATYCKWVLTLQAPQPYWVSVQAVSFSVSADGGVKGLLPELDRLLVKSSQVLGTFTVDNPGDVEAYPVWTIEGPSTNVSITQSSIGWTYTETLVGGNLITVNTQNATVANSAGTNKYAFLGSAPKLFAIPAGSSSLSVVMTGTSSASKVSGFFRPRREVLF
jgi:phage-related protein